MDGVVQTNTAQTDELASTAQSLAERGGELQSLVGRFKLVEANGGASGSSAHPTRVASARSRPGEGRDDDLEDLLVGATSPQGTAGGSYEGRSPAGTRYECSTPGKRR